MPTAVVHAINRASRVWRAKTAAAGLAALCGLAVATSADATPPCLAQSPCACAAPATQPAKGAPLKATVFGVSTVLFSDGDSQLLIDGYFSRPNLIRSFTTPIGPDVPLVRRTLQAHGVTNLKAVLVAHAHHDHALDAPEIARWTGAALVGSSSVANLAEGSGVPRGQICPAGHNAAFAFGPWRVTTVAIPHGRQGFLERRLLEGEIKRPMRQPAFAWRYKDRGSLAFIVEHAGRRVLVHPTAGVTPGAYRRLPPVGAAFIAVSRVGVEPPGFAPAYWYEVVRASGASVVVPTHWDMLTRPLGEPLRPTGRPFDDAAEGLRRIRLLEGRGVDLVELDSGHSLDLSAIEPREDRRRP